jgi:bifunctional DNase/RNase
MKFFDNDGRKRILRAGVFAAFAVAMACGGALAGEAVCSEDANTDDLIKVKVQRLIVDPASGHPVVILSDALERRALPIWIGRFEANAIGSEMRGIRHPRPLTHDLLETVIRESGFSLERVVITHLKEGTFHAYILMKKNAACVRIDARPSDSIVMALKVEAPIFIFAALFARAAVPLGGNEAIEKDYGIRIQELTPALARAFAYESTTGALVSGVRPESRAEKDGIQRGDILVKIGGLTTGDPKSVRRALEEGGSPVKAEIFRKGEFISLRLHPKERQE